MEEVIASGNTDLYDNGDILCDPDYTDDKDLYPITMSCNETVVNLHFLVVT